MKRYFILFILFFYAFNGKAQLASKEVHEKTAAVILTEYNSKNYGAIYKLLEPSFKKQITEKELGDFFKLNLLDIYGTMKSLTHSEYKGSFHLFIGEFQNGKMDLQLSCNSEQQISGMGWSIHQEKLPEVPSLNTGNLKSDNPLATRLEIQIDSIVKKYHENNSVCGLSIAVFDGTNTKFYNYGESARGKNELPSSKTIYEIGSVSKVFTGILLANAISEKKVSANDPLKKHLGDTYKNLSYKGKQIELVHLSNHTSRIQRIPADLTQQTSYNPSNPYKHYTREMLLKYISTLSIDTFPGTKNEYSNLGTVLLAVILEKVYGTSYEELVKEKITAPLKMLNTKIVLNEDEEKRFAEGHNSYGQATEKWDLACFVGAGGLRSTSEDMIQFVKVNLADTLPSFKLSHYSTFNNGRDNVGMAWQLTTTKKGNELIWHNGMTQGFSSFCGFIKSKNSGVVVLNNTGIPCDQIAIGILKMLQ